MSEDTSFYKQIDNVEYSRRLINIAEECVAGQGDGRIGVEDAERIFSACLLYTSPSPRDLSTSRMPSSA